MNTLFQLITLKKGGLSIPDYFQKTKNFSDVLFAISQPVSEPELISYILAGLPTEYDSLITSINICLKPMALDERFGDFLHHEMRLEQLAIVTEVTLSYANIAARQSNNYD